MGKTTVALCLADFDLTLVDTDEIARSLTATDGAAIPAIVETFSNDVITREGALDREKMALRVFRDADERRALEGILHPLIRKQWQQAVEPFRDNPSRWVVVVIPLLFETGVEASFDSVGCVACRENEQMERLSARGWTRQHSLDRKQSQWPIEDKIRRSHFVIWTSCELEITKRQLIELPWVS